MPGNDIGLREIREALVDLDTLSQAEYGLSLEEVLLTDMPDASLRLQRLTGIILKRHFARPGGRPAFSQTGAQRSWHWNDTPPDASANIAPREFWVLNELRMPGSWNESKPATGTAEDLVPISWDRLKDDADHERGLFKILVLYVEDKLRGRGPRTLREYVEAKESRRFETGLDLAALVFDAGVTAPVVALLGVPSLAVGIALVGVQYGYRRLTDTAVERVGDSSN